MAQMTRRVRRRVGATLVMAATVLGAGLAPATPVRAAAPPPPLDACLSRSSFAIGDPRCLGYMPEWGNQFGPISSIEVLEVERGVPIKLGGPGAVDTFTINPAPWEQCGELGCPRDQILWRRGSAPGIQGVGFLSGCTVTDVNCVVAYAPPMTGDRGEFYQVVFGEQYHGITPTGNSRMWALYTPPVFYPVTLTPVDTGGSQLRLPPGSLAYAVREGTDPVQADCMPSEWPGRDTRALPDPLPDCVTFIAQSLYTDDGPFGGMLPVDTGTWTVIAQVAGDPRAPLRSRPSGFRHAEVTPVGDDIATTIVGERRPRVSLEVGERTAEMELGSSQVIDVTVAAVGGEAGSLEGLTFTQPTILGAVDPDAAVLEILDPDGGPIKPFSLLPGESRTFPVEVHAVGLGDVAVSVAVSGRDDLGTPLSVEQGGTVSVVFDPDPEGGAASAEAPQAPVIEHARDLGGGSEDTIDGVVEGDPETTVTVSLATALEEGRGDACVGRMTGDGVQSLGSFPVTIGADGVGRFSRTGALTPGWTVVGVTVVGPHVSAVSDCTPVTVASPTISIDDVDVTEGEPATFTVSLSAPSESPVRVRVGTADDGATAPADYTRLRDHEVTIEPGAWTAVLEVPTAKDRRAEEPETFRVLLSHPVGGEISAVDGSGTDPEGVATIVDGEADGGEAIDVRGTWTVTLAGQPARYELVIKTQDPATGAISGTLDVGQRVPVTGTVRGGRLELKLALGGRSSRGAGDLKHKNGRLTASIPLRDDQGTVGTLKLTLTDPRE